MNDQGVASDFSQSGTLLSTSSIGENITCSSFNNGPVTEREGTSYSAAAMTGLMTYLWGNPEFQAEIDGEPGQPGNPASRMKSLIRSLHWQRQNGNVPVIWNEKQSPLTGCSPNNKRQAGSCLASPSPASSSPSGPSQPVSFSTSPTSSSVSSTNIIITETPTISPASTNIIITETPSSS
ncbi:hypothetical protein BDZ45DRAFT_137634 [Acephala macrosclerotiorum]|nr:hypothetical protein BDZ45DRAFT_137634 [Acephala macrosclerotiorum]